MVLSLDIQNAIEQEIDRRVHEKMEKVLKMVASSYKINFDRLLKDVASMKTDENDTPSNICCGILKSGGKCKSKSKNGSYCKRHEDQKPKTFKAVKQEQSEVSQSSFLQGLKNSKARKEDVEVGDSSQVT
jgi:hypothetical protein